MSDHVTGAEPSSETSGRGRPPVAVLAAAAVVLGLLLLWLFINGLRVESTDDAFLDGPIVLISPKVGAEVLRVFVTDNQAVAAGDPLVELDPRDYEVRVRMAEAELAAARAEEEQALQDEIRYEKLSATDEVSKQQRDRAVLRARTAGAKVRSAEAAFQRSRLDLSYTHLLAPVTGHVARKAVEPGMVVQPGQPLMALVAGSVWVVANFKETQLARMRPGQPVDIRVDACPRRSWPGHVDSIQRGTGARFSLFPPENAAGNFVKVVQRVPVKIVFEQIPDDGCVLSVGMSAVPKVRVR